MSTRWYLAAAVAAPLLLHPSSSSAQAVKHVEGDSCNTDYVYCICEGGPAHPRFFEVAYGDDEALEYHTIMV